VIYRAKSRLRRLLNGHEDVKTLLRQSLSNRMRVSHEISHSRRVQKSETKHLEVC
jgi:hypothetical protein